MEKKTIAQLKLLRAIDKGAFNFDELRAEIAETPDPADLPAVRTVRRYMSELERAGFPWWYDRRTDRYQFTEGFSLRANQMDDTKLASLLAVQRAAESLGPDFQSNIMRLSAIGGAEATPSVSLRAGYFEFSDQVNDAISTLGRAQHAHRQVSFSYADKYGQISTRKVDPYGITMSDGRAYLIGFDHSRNDRRTFALDNISGIQSLPSTFVRPPDFDLGKHGARSISGLAEADELAETTVRFSPVVAKAALAASAQHQREINPQPNGAIDITFHVADQLELIRWSMRYGSEAEVIAPEAARTAAADIALSLATKYVPSVPAGGVGAAGPSSVSPTAREGLPGLPYVDLEALRDERGFERVAPPRRSAPGAQFTGQIIEVGSTAVGEELAAIAVLDSGRRTITPLVVEPDQARTLAELVGGEPVVARYDRATAGWTVEPLVRDHDVEIVR